MKLALNGATIMRSPIEGDVEIASACGYDGIELWAAKVDAYENTSGLDALARRLRDCGLRPSLINSIENITSRDETGRNDVLRELRRRVEMARALNAEGIVVVPSCQTDAVPREDAIRDAVEVLRSMSDAAGAVKLAFEFLGKPGCTVPTLDMAIEIVERADRANVGMVLDVFHFYAGGSDVDDVRRLPIDRLFMVHLNGVEDLPREELTDAHRLYPGEGPTPTIAILRALRERGYDGTASVEIFRPEYWEQNADDVARIARERAVAVLKAAGYDA